MLKVELIEVVELCVVAVLVALVAPLIFTVPEIEAAILASELAK